MWHTHHNSGFTLIEMSIVLVIIGLIVGGIVLGQSLIHQGEIRKSASQINELQTAINTFKIKYNCLPGDCPNATDFFGVGNVYNGNGDGIIGNDNSNNWGDGGCANYNPDIIVEEEFNALNHLGNAGLVHGVFLAVDPNSFTGPIGDPATGYPVAANYGYQLPLENAVLSFNDCPSQMMWDYNPANMMSANWLTLTAVVWGSEGAGGSGWLGAIESQPSVGIWAIDAQALDQKIDDGLPLSGKVLSISDSNAGVISCPLQDGSNAYDLGTKPWPTCGLSIELDW